MISIRVVHPEDLHDIRRRVLRAGDPNARVHDDRDHDADAIHFAAFYADNVVGSASVYPSPFPHSEREEVAYQLRYLAVDSSLQRNRIGSNIMQAVEDRLRYLGVRTLWANGRDTALDFYQATGWNVVEGSDHLSPETQLPHHLIVKTLSG